MIELKALNLHWLESLEPNLDLCAHSPVYLKIDDFVVSDKDSGVWAVNASAFYLLKTLTEDHIGEEKPQIFPHCGFNIWAVGEEENEVLISGCPIGIDWTITHSENKVIHKFSERKIIKTDFEEWRKAICDFSDEVMDFYKKSESKEFNSEEDQKGFELFMKEWEKLREKAFE